MKILLYLSILKLFLLSTIQTYGRDLIINEIMANPRNGQLPAFEYIELMNNGESVQNLAEIGVQINNQTLSLPPYLLSPGQLVILCAQEAEISLSNYGNVIPFLKWPALNNTGATIRLNRKEIIIDEVSYKDSWHQNSLKKEGGWSLERINPNWHCNIAATWLSSTAQRGGTPGKPNSVFNKVFGPEVKVITASIRGKNIFIKFNLDKIYLPSLSKELFYINQGEVTPTRVSWNENQDTLILFFDNQLASNKLYRLSFQPVEICGVNTYISDYLLFQQQEDIEYNDIIVNEVLFNPKEGGVDFVELYNRTGYPLNLSGWKLGNRIITDEVLLLSPDDFIVLTIDKEKLCSTYPNAIQNRIHQMTSLPSYPNQQGTVTIFSPQGLVDSLYYHANMHDALITNSKGISLERQSYENETNTPHNFRSAATIVGGATPGYRNSMYVDNFFKKNNIFLSSKTVSPDGDFFEDKLEINYNLLSPDYMLNLYIYNEKGILIKRLITNQSSGLTGKIIWDGLDENNQEAMPGHYIYWAELYAKNGFRETFKEAFILLRKSLRY